MQHKIDDVAMETFVAWKICLVLSMLTESPGQLLSSYSLQQNLIFHSEQMTSQNHLEMTLAYVA